MVKTNLNEIVSSVEPLKALLDLKLPVKVSYWIGKLAKGQLQRELDHYNRERDKIINELGTPNEDSTVSVKDPEKLKEFQKRLSELLEIEVELDFNPISIESLGDIQIEPKNMVSFIFE